MANQAVVKVKNVLKTRNEYRRVEITHKIRNQRKSFQTITISEEALSAK